MAWQDIYGEMQDDCGRTAQHTSSRRGIVKNISFHTKSHALDTVIDLSVLSADRDKKFMQTGEIKRKIQEWKNKESHTKGKDAMITYWENKLKVAESKNAEAKQKNKVKILINFPAINKVGIADKELLVHFEGIELDVKDLQAISDNPLRVKQLLQELKEGKIR
jgi:hypothetical protein